MIYEPRYILLIISIKCLGNPLLSSILKSFALLTLSDALTQSINMICMSLLYSRCVSIICFKIVIFSVQLLTLLKPDSSSRNNTYSLSYNFWASDKLADWRWSYGIIEQTFDKFANRSCGISGRRAMLSLALLPLIVGSNFTSSLPIFGVAP